MKNKILSLILAISILFSLFTLTVSATDPSISDMRKAFEAVNTAVKNMETLLGKEQTSTISKIFNGFVGTASKISPIFGMVNGGVTFLKLVGLMKDSNSEALANIMRELNIISDKMNEMDKKLDSITDSVTTLHANTEFNDRMNKALSYKESWRLFRREYMENGLDKKMTDYNALVLNGLKAWFINEKADSRTEGNVDNSSITVIYAKDEEGKVRLYLTDKNTVPSSVNVVEKYSIAADELPKTVEWDAKSNENRLTAIFEDTIRTKYTSENTNTDFSKVAADAYATLVYRIASKEVNKDAAFPLEVARLFDNYCTFLFEAGEGVDSYIKALFLTHAFEYEIRDEINAFFDRMILETATYGAFVSGVLSMSGFTTESDLNLRLDNLSKAINALDGARNSCITGRRGYCYITNCEVVYGYDIITMSGEYRVRTKPLRDYNYVTSTFLGSKLFPTTYDAIIDGKNDGGLIGDINALVIMYTLRANGITPTNDYLSKSIGSGRVKNYGAVLTSRKAQTTLGFSDSVKMEVFWLIGDYFYGKSGGKLNFKNLPSDCDDDDFTYRQKITGSLLDLSTNEIASGSLIAAFAGYGEGHWYWNNDEVAFLCGPYKTDNSVEYKLNEEKEYYGVAHIGYERKYTLESRSYFNTLHCVISDKKVSSNGYNPLNDLSKINEELGFITPVIEPKTEGDELSHNSSEREKINLPLVIGISAAVIVISVTTVAIIKLKKKKKS